MSKADRIESVIAEKDLEIARLRGALEQSINLQSHYAGLLNMRDGGKRTVVKNADEWLKRLKWLTDLGDITK